MKIRILGAGWYGCHLGLSLLADGHDVEIHESSGRIFNGASGSIPARVHQGFHYPRSYSTRIACAQHYEPFMRRYGHLTSAVPINVYAIAQDHSLVDFGTYLEVLEGRAPFLPIYDPSELGLKNVEGAVLTGERHVVTRKAREYFEKALSGRVSFNVPKTSVHSPNYDWTIDCTFCANDAAGVDRYEPCITTILRGPTNQAVTVMDGPFPSIYPWDEDAGLVSLTSAKYTPLARCKTRAEAEAVMDTVDTAIVKKHADLMVDQISSYWPLVREAFEIEDCLLSIRAMPLSAADARLVDVVRIAGRALRVRAGKIDAVLNAEALVRAIIEHHVDPLSLKPELRTVQ